MSQVRWRQISSARLGFAFPEKILMPPVVLIGHYRLPIVDCRFQELAGADRNDSQSEIANWQFQSWLGRVDSNQRMPVPKTGALPLGYAPVSDCRFIACK